MSGFCSVGSILKGLTRSASWGPGLERNEVVRRWKDVVGPAVAEMANPVEVKGRTLYVDVRDPVWLQQMVYMRESVRRALNEAVGKAALDRIYFRQADGPFKPEDEEDPLPAGRVQERRKWYATRVPNPAESREALSKIPNEDVRKAFAALLDRVRRMKP